MINEVPLVMGKVDPDQHLCSGSVEQLALVDIESTAGAYPDGSESPCTWIPSSSAAKAEAAGFQTWDAAAYIEMHLRSIAIRNLSRFVSVDELTTSLNAHSRGSAYLLSRLHSAQGGFPRFTRAIRALLAEELPIAPVTSLAERYLDLVQTPIYELTEELRRLPPIIAYLLRDIREWRVFKLSRHDVDLIRKHLVCEGDVAVLAMDRDVLDDMRDEISSGLDTSCTQGTQPVLLVDDWRIRPFVRKLVEADFPRLRVVDRSEIVAPSALPEPVATIGTSADEEEGDKPC
jgi:flagellar biosynthesis component FlhA